MDRASLYTHTMDGKPHPFQKPGVITILLLAVADKLLAVEQSDHALAGKSSVMESSIAYNFQI